MKSKASTRDGKSILKWCIIVGGMASVVLLAVFLFADRGLPKNLSRKLSEEDVQQMRAKKAEEIYGLAVKFAAENPQQFDNILMRLRLVASGFKDTPYGAKAAEQIAPWEKRRLESAAKRLKAAEDFAATHPASEMSDFERIRSAFQEVRDGFGGTAESEEAQRQMDVWEGKLNAKAKGMLDEALEFASRNPSDYETVIRRLQEVGRKFFGTPAADATINAMAVVIGKRRAEREDRAAASPSDNATEWRIPQQWRARRFSDSEKRDLIVVAGGRPEVEDAVLKSLRALAKKQQANGSWGEGVQVAMTSFSLMAFLAHGETPSSAEFGGCVKRGLDFLLRQAEKIPSGSVPEYETPIMACALAEAYGLTGDARYLPPLQASVTWMIDKQSLRGGWGYLQEATALPAGVPPEFNQFRSVASGSPDISITAWHIQALKAAYLVGVERQAVCPVLDKAVAFVKLLYTPESKGFGYIRPETGGRQGLGALSMLTWELMDDPELKDVMTSVNEDVKLWMIKNGLDLQKLWVDWRWSYGCFFLTQAMFLYDGPRGEQWRQWSGKYMDALMKRQNATGGFFRNDKEEMALWEESLLTLILMAPYRVLQTER